MQSQNRIFEDMSKIATSAMGTMAGVGREVEGMIRQRVRELVGDVDMVGRDEFEAVKAMAATARADAEALKAELAAMKATMASTPPAPGEMPPSPGPGEVPPLTPSDVPSPTDVPPATPADVPPFEPRDESGAEGTGSAPIV